MIPSNHQVVQITKSLTGKMNSRNPLTKQNAKKDLDGMKLYYEVVKKKNQIGKGIRRYNQPKRNAYKISQKGQYGGLVIDLPKLLGHLKVVAHKNGKVQNMDPWSMDPLRGPGPWTGSMDPFHGPGPWTPYFYYP